MNGSWDEGSAHRIFQRKKEKSFSRDEILGSLDALGTVGSPLPPFLRPPSVPSPLPLIHFLLPCLPSAHICVMNIAHARVRVVELQTTTAGTPPPGCAVRVFRYFSVTLQAPMELVLEGFMGKSGCSPTRALKLRTALSSLRRPDVTFRVAKLHIPKSPNQGYGVILGFFSCMLVPPVIIFEVQTHESTDQMSAPLRPLRSLRLVCSF